MITDIEKRKALILYRIQQANETALEVSFLIENNKLKNASNRIYYAMFYALTSLALLYKFKTSKHQQLLGWFNKEFVSNHIFDRKYAKMIKEAFDKRNETDYEPFIDVSIDEINILKVQMNEFISAIEKYILENQNKSLD